MNQVLFAVQKAKKHIKELIVEPEERLAKMTKKQLIAEVIRLSGKAKTTKINNVVYSILEDPDCAWLTWDVIASLITENLPNSKTTPDSLRWYPSEGTKKGKAIIPRKPVKEIAAVLTQSFMK